MAEDTSGPELGDTTEVMSGVRLILVRHGESNVTVQQVVGGPLTCSGLSDLGRIQAAALRDRFAAGHEPTIDELWASTMPRAKETAEILNEQLGLELQIDGDLEERRPGEADGTPWAEFGDRFEYDHNNPFSPLSPGGESAVDFAYRVEQAVHRVIEQAAAAPQPGDADDATPRERTVLIVCHGGVVDVVFRHLLSTQVHAGFHLWTLNTSLSEFRTRDLTHPKVWQLVRYNDSAHLAGLPRRTETS